VAKPQIGQNLKHIRADHRYKQEYVAKMLDITQAAYSDYENNKIVPTLENMIKLAELYNCTIDDILNDTVKSPRQKKIEETEKAKKKKVSIF
jgi:transcriptional regulator with XRE-family HTH domain